MTRDLRPYESAIAKVQDDFARADNGLDYNSEKIFALQQLTKTNYARDVATKNPLSVRLAMLNLAATGLSLNPAHKFAFLVPRDGAIVLEISYIGLLKIATDTGAIAWGRAEVVHDGDAFIYHGPARAPEHSCDPFHDRGEIIGAYCIAKTTGGDMLTEVISRAQIETIRGKSDLFSRKGSGPWAEFFSEMCKKAVIKRAQKTWPKSDKTSRLLDAIEIANASEGGYTLDAEPVAQVDEQQRAMLDTLIADFSPEQAKQFLSIFGVESTAAIPAFRFGEAIAYAQGSKLLAFMGAANANS
jgi:recombination protein RecT